MAANSKEKLDEIRKRNIRDRNSIRAAFKEHPEALSALERMFDHSASTIGKSQGNQVFVMLGHKEVIEVFARTNAMGYEDE
jgi:hypothetical protein